MAKAHERSKRKSTGGMFKPHSKRKKRNLVGEFSSTTEGEEVVVKHRKSRGKTQKLSLDQTNFVNVSTDEGETVKTEIEDVAGNPANPDFVRRGIITKGSIVETSEGKVEITSRPGQDGTLNGKIVEED